MWRRRAISGLVVLVASSGLVSISEAAPVAASSLDCQPTPGYVVRFCDGFDGTSLNSTIWNASANGGNISVANGWVTLSSAGAAFPYVLARSNPFPTSGSFRVTVGFRYDSAGSYGVGFSAHDSAPTNGTIADIVPGTSTARVWQDTSAFSTNNECESSPLPAADLAAHVAQFDFGPGSSRAVTLDGTNEGACTASTLPTALWFGNPVVPTPCVACEWSQLSIDFIRVDVPNGSYVALGDSFSSGEGNPPFQSGTNVPTNECHRSLTKAYPDLLAASPKAKADNLRFVACSGATLPDLVGASTTTAGQWGETPQIKTLLASGKPNPNVALVTISIGGNDLGFGSDLSACISGYLHAENSCQASSQTRFNRAKTELTRGGDYTIATDGVGWLSGSNKLPTTCTSTKTKGCIATPALAGLYEQIHKDAPNAAIRVLGYPEFFPASPTKQCTVGTFHSLLGSDNYVVNVSNMKFLNGLATQANALVSSQVAAAHSGGVANIRYVPTITAFAGHTLCSSAPWLNGLLWSGSVVTDISSSSFHPTAQGQQTFERLIAATL